MKIRLKNGDVFNMPDWQDCTWKRRGCGRDDCRICGKMKKQRERHMANGRDPDSAEAMMMDMEANLKETCAMIERAAKRDGFDVEKAMKEFDKDAALAKEPKAEDYPLCVEAMEWAKSARNIFSVGVGEDESWWYSDASHDVMHYSNTLGAKIFRQSTSRDELETGDAYTDVDYLYTKYALEFTMAKLKESLTALMNKVMGKRVEIMIALAALSEIEPKVEKLNNFFGQADVGVMLFNPKERLTKRPRKRPMPKSLKKKVTQKRSVRGRVEQ